MPWVSRARLGDKRSDFSSRASTASESEPTLSKQDDEKAEQPKNASVTSRPPPPLPFKFGYRKQPIDWRVLHGIDIDRMVRETDIETLERCVGAVTFGDLESEDARNLTEINFMRIFRLGQLTAEYLLHVQDRLAYDNTLLKDEKVHKEKHIRALKERCHVHRDSLNSAKQDIRRLKKTVATLEEAVRQEQASKAVAFPTPQIPAAQAPSDAAWKVERLERMLKELQQERTALLQNLAEMKRRLTKHDAEGREELAAELARVRSEERNYSKQRLKAAQSEVQDLRDRLDHMANSQVEMQNSAATNFESTLSELNAKTRSQEELMSQLRIELEDKNALLESRQAGVEDTRKALDRAEAKIKRLEQQDLDESSAAVQEVESLQEDIAELKQKVKQLHDEHHRLGSENSVLQKEKMEVDAKLQQLEASLGKMFWQQADEAKEQELKDKTQKEKDQEEKEKERLEKEREEAEQKLKQDAESKLRKKLQSRSWSQPALPRLKVPSSDAYDDTLPPASESRPWVVADHPPSPTRVEQGQWDREYMHELRPWDRPGVKSRTKVPRSKFLVERPEVQDLLEDELEEELASYGIDPSTERLSNEQYEAAMKELLSRQQAAEEESDPKTVARIKQIRSLLAWHLHKTADAVDRDYKILANGQVAYKEKPQPNPGMPPPRPASPLRRRFRSASPPKSGGFLGKLCSRFKSPGRREARYRARMEQAAIAQYRDTYGHSPLNPVPPYFAKDGEKHDLNVASNRFYQPLLTGKSSMTNEEMSQYVGKARSRSASPSRSRPRAPSSPRRAAKVDMATFKRMGPSKPHATLLHAPRFRLDESCGCSEEGSDDAAEELRSPGSRKVIRKKVTETWEQQEEPSFSGDKA